MSNYKNLLDTINILKPYQYSNDLLKAASGEANDISWMKRRYKKFMKEFYYVLSSSVLINTCQFNGFRNEDMEISGNSLKGYKMP
jgi:hypothetical protein